MEAFIYDVESYSGCRHPGRKFDSRTRRPSFYAPISEENIREETNLSHGMRRTEVMCDVCGGHLGHVFSDGPQRTGQRYCLNSAALTLDRRR